MTKRKVDRNFTRPAGSNADILVAVCNNEFFKCKIHYNELTPDLDRERVAREQSNIYMICSRPKATIAPESIQMVEKDSMTSLVGLIKLQIGIKERTFPFSADPESILTEWLSHYEARSQLQVEDTKISFLPGEYPHTTVKAHIDVFLKDGSTKKICWEMELENLSFHFHWAIPELQDLEVQYIGRSVGDIHDSNSPKRLEQKHDPRRDIMAQASRRQDIDVIVLYLNFQASLQGNGKFVQIEMPKTNVIDLIEGALINHFKPSQNEECINSFPKDRIKRAEAQALGIKRSMVLLDTSFHATRVFTQCVPPHHLHSLAHEFNSSGAASKDMNADCSGEPSHRRGPDQLETLAGNSEYISNLYRYLTRPRSMLDKFWGLLSHQIAARRNPVDSEGGIS